MSACSEDGSGMFFRNAGNRLGGYWLPQLSILRSVPGSYNVFLLATWGTVDLLNSAAFLLARS
jgi:hypothetical protein